MGLTGVKRGDPRVDRVCCGGGWLKGNDFITFALGKRLHWCERNNVDVLLFYCHFTHISRPKPRLMLLLNNSLLEQHFAWCLIREPINHSTNKPVHMYTAPRRWLSLWFYYFWMQYRNERKIIMHMKQENKQRLTYTTPWRKHKKIDFELSVEISDLGYPELIKVVFTNLCRSSVYHWWTYFDQIYTYMCIWVKIWAREIILEIFLKSTPMKLNIKGYRAGRLPFSL